MRGTFARRPSSRNPSPARAAVLALLVAVAAGVGTSAFRLGPRCQAATAASIASVDTVGMTVADMDRALAFYGTVLGFEKVSDVEVAGRQYELLQDLFGLRMRVVGMRLGQERLELTEYLAPRGRPYPVDTRANDRWFQHAAVIVRDMDAAYARLRANRVEHASTGPQRLPDWNPNAGGIRAFYFRDPDEHFLEILQFPPGGARGAGTRRAGPCSSASTTPRSSFATPTSVCGSTGTSWA